MSEIEFTPWPKIARLNRHCVVTEKIDGTNSAIGIMEDGQVYAQSRNRIITPGKSTDNHGFAQFVEENKVILSDTLGVGVHFGEWYGRGIGKRYTNWMQGRAFALFNTDRWSSLNMALPSTVFGDVNISSTPVFYEGAFNTEIIEEIVNYIANHGSSVAPGALAEGVVIHHVASQVNFKVTCENDEKPKGSKELG